MLNGPTGERATRYDERCTKSRGAAGGGGTVVGTCAENGPEDAATCPSPASPTSHRKTGSDHPAARAQTAELLAPAGGPDAFAAAVAAGADAIYCGMGGFNARRKAENFTDDEFQAACRTAHLAGARVYVTVNIVIKDREMAEALELVRRCASLGADAFIIQDWGLFFEVKRLMPELETHISTQANIHDRRGAEWCREAGADRVTLSRELSLDEIREAAQADIELEVFAHGSICFCYSGLCMLSVFTGNGSDAGGGRSANRGMCAQPCRLPYTLIDEQDRTLSAPGRGRALCPRDNCTIGLLPKLLDAGATALKLEGRMKAPDYVYSVTSVYREQLDDVAAGRKPSQEEATDRARRLKRCFNRDFTTEYQLGRSGDEMMSYERSNNRGQVVGEVMDSRPVGSTAGLRPTDRRVRAAMVRIKLFEPVGEGDLLELRHDDEWDQFLTVIAHEDAPAGAVIECRAARAMPAGATARLIRSQAALDASSAALKREVPCRRKVDVRIRAHLGEPFAVTLTCCDAPELSATTEGFLVEPARTRAVTSEDLIEHVGRMGGTPFEAASFAVEFDQGCGMGFSAVHKVRAQACDALETRILAPYRKRAERFAKLPPFDTSVRCIERVEEEARAARGSAGDDADAPARRVPEVCALATSLEAADAARAAGATRIYMLVDSLEAANLTPDDAEGRGIVPVLDEVSREADHARLDPWVRPGAPVAVCNISELALAAERGATAEVRSCLPVHNLACLEALAARGAHGFWLSPELSLSEIEHLGPHAGTCALGISVIGRPRVMTSEHCILQVADACIHDCARCGLRRRKLELENIDGKRLPVRTDVHGRSRLYAPQPLDLTPQLPELLAAGVSRFLVDGTLMEPDELARMVDRTTRALDDARAGRKPAPRMKGASTGCLFREVA